MLDDRYNVKAADDLTSFEFDSIGPKGIIRKVVRYTEINLKGFYNLGFGDKDPLTGYISDVSVTNNNDSKKVLATVAATLYAFTNFYPDVTVLATGSTNARTRLYRMGISNNLSEIEVDFTVLGLTENRQWQRFQKNITYSAFLIKRKS
jgi:hypothetical protein